MKPSLHLKMNQHLAMTPQLQHAIHILQLSSIELEQEIQQFLSCNPLLENEEPAISDEEAIEPENNSLNNLKDLNYVTNEENTINNYSYIGKQCDDDYQHYLQGSYLQENFNKLYDSGFSRLEIFHAKNHELTLQKHLTWQMELAHFSEEEHAIAWTIIDAISEDGYLTSTLEDIASSTGLAVSASVVESVLTKIHQFEPIGVGARTLIECLTLQLENITEKVPHLPEAKLIVANYLDLLAKRDYQKLKTILKISENDLQDIIKILTSLDPKPGRKISAKKTDYIIPDVIVRKIATEQDNNLDKANTLYKPNILENSNNYINCSPYTVELNKDFVPKLRINPKYSNIVQKVYRENNIILKEQLKEAKWFIKSLQTRQQTLLKVASHIIETQKDFLEHGEEFMKPLTLQDVAEVLGLHESTISRITNQKYILTPKGVYELKYFFTHQVSAKKAYTSTYQNNFNNCPDNSLNRDQKKNMSDKENPVSAKSVRALIKKWIHEETPQNPYSDQQIAEKLKEKDIHIARRTVAKYRESLRIPASHERKMCILNSK